MRRGDNEKSVVRSVVRCALDWGHAWLVDRALRSSYEFALAISAISVSHWITSPAGSRCANNSAVVCRTAWRLSQRLRGRSVPSGPAQKLCPRARLGNQFIPVVRQLGADALVVGDRDFAATGLRNCLGIEVIFQGAFRG